jgi:hypothetical protein
MEDNSDAVGSFTNSQMGLKVLRPIWRELQDKAIAKLEETSAKDLCCQAHNSRQKAAINLMRLICDLIRRASMASLHDSEDPGARFIPLIMGMGLIKGVIPITNEVVFGLVRQTAAVEELRGEALAAAFELCESLEMSGWHVVVIIPSFAERYISTPFLDKL